MAGKRGVRPAYGSQDHGQAWSRSNDQKVYTTVLDRMSVERARHKHRCQAGLSGGHSQEMCRLSLLESSRSQHEDVTLRLRAVEQVGMCCCGWDVRGVCYRIWKSISQKI